MRCRLADVFFTGGGDVQGNLRQHRRLKWNLMVASPDRWSFTTPKEEIWPTVMPSSKTSPTFKVPLPLPPPHRRHPEWAVPPHPPPPGMGRPPPMPGMGCTMSSSGQPPPPPPGMDSPPPCRRQLQECASDRAQEVGISFLSKILKNTLKIWPRSGIRKKPTPDPGSRGKKTTVCRWFRFAQLAKGKKFRP